jgi:hypothetical protein
MTKNIHDRAESRNNNQRSPPKKPTRKPTKQAKQDKPAPAKPKWSPSDPDLLNWQSMCEYARFYRKRLSDRDREYLERVLLGETGFDCGRATPELMIRLRSIVVAIDAARDAAPTRGDA